MAADHAVWELLGIVTSVLNNKKRDALITGIPRNKCIGPGVTWTQIAVSEGSRLTGS